MTNAWYVAKFGCKFWCVVSKKRLRSTDIHICMFFCTLRENAEEYANWFSWIATDCKDAVCKKHWGRAVENERCPIFDISDRSRKEWYFADIGNQHLSELDVVGLTNQCNHVVLNDAIELERYGDLAAIGWLSELWLRVKSNAILVTLKK